MSIDGINPLDYLLYESIIQDSKKMVLFTLSIGANINYKNIDNQNLLSITYNDIKPTMLGFLIQCGIDINNKDINGNTFLHIIAIRRKHILLHYLIRFRYIKLKANILNKNMMSPLHILIENGYIKMFRCFISRYPNIIHHRGSFNMNALHYACKYNHYTIVEFILHISKTIQYKKDILDCDALYYACESQSLEIIELLLDHGMNIHIRDKTTDSSAIHWACMSGNYKIIEFLLENGANPNDIDDEFDSPLHALINGYYLEKHINQEEINNIVNLLVRYGANVNYQNRNGDTPLHFMIFTYSFSVINNIIEAGANVTIMNNQNETPLDTALSEGRLIDSRIISILH